MRIKFLLTLIGIQLLFFANAQQKERTTYWNVLKKISNNNADFYVSNPVRFKDSTGNISSIKNIVVFENKYMGKVSKKYGERLLPDLVQLLNDSTRDWAANLLLYNITYTDAVVLKYYSGSKIQEWRASQKQKDVARWDTYIKEQKIER